MIRNAVITHARLGLGGYQEAMLGLYVYVKFEDGCSGMVEGHYSLYLPPTWKHHSAICPLGHVVWRWLRAADVNAVDELVGKAIRCDIPGDGSFGSTCVPDRVGHIVLADRWFSTKDICDEFRAKMSLVNDWVESNAS